MKNIQYLLKPVCLLLAIFCFTSCLENGLDDLPVYEEANITDFYFEYRYEVPRSDGVQEVTYTRMTNNSRGIGETTVDIEITVPEADGNFTEAERNKVSLTNLVGYCYLSTAATIQPVDGAPELGKPGDFSSPVKYKVTAADGKNSKVWTITVTLIK